MAAYPVDFYDQTGVFLSRKNEGKLEKFCIEQKNENCSLLGLDIPDKVFVVSLGWLVTPLTKNDKM